jgi:hypothetical protein
VWLFLNGIFESFSTRGVQKHQKKIEKLHVKNVLQKKLRKKTFPCHRVFGRFSA